MAAEEGPAGSQLQHLAARRPASREQAAEGPAALTKHQPGCLSVSVSLQGNLANLKPSIWAGARLEASSDAAAALTGTYPFKCLWYHSSGGKCKSS